MAARRTILLLLAFCSVAACARPVGDFGRPARSVLHDAILPSLSQFAREPLQLTEAERQLRRFAEGYAAPAPRPQGDAGNRPLHLGHADEDASAYARALLETPYRSATARYVRLMEDMHADTQRAGQFAAVAREIAELDARREAALAQDAQLSAEAREQTKTRIEENRRLIAGIAMRLAERKAGYRLALDRLAQVEPAPAESDARRALVGMERRFAQLRLTGDETVGSIPASRSRR